MRSIPLSLLIIILIMTIIPSNANGSIIPLTQDQLRVALNLQEDIAEVLISQGSYQLLDYLNQGNLVDLDAGMKVTVTPVGKGNLKVAINGQSISKMAGSIILLRPEDPSQLNLFKYLGTRYRDTLLIENNNGKLNIINLISVEKYLYGVVGGEIGANSPTEALKAQAVVSRTYAMYYKEHPQLSYDVGIGTSWQVYGGYDMEILGGEKVKNAVDSTKGQVIYYDGKIIQAFFHANSGGHTENSENVWWAYIPYIRGVPAPEDSYALHYPVQEGGWPANTYQWTKTFTMGELTEQIKKFNREYPDNTVNVGSIIDLKINKLCVDPFSSPRRYLDKPTPSLRVSQLDIVGSKGTKTVYRDTIRRVFDLRSLKFDLFFDSTIKIISAVGQNTVNSVHKIVALGTNGIVEEINNSNKVFYVQDVDGIKEVPKNFNSVIFTGNGYGHGLGMSQWGAKGLAVQGYDYQQIIKHYYNNNNFDGKLSIDLLK